MRRALLPALLLFAVVIAAALVATRGPVVVTLDDSITVTRPLPLDTLALQGIYPDSLQIDFIEPGVFCIWSWRDGELLRWPNESPLRTRLTVDLDSMEGRPIEHVENLPGEQACTRVYRRSTESIT